MDLEPGAQFLNQPHDGKPKINLQMSEITKFPTIGQNIVYILIGLRNSGLNPAGKLVGKEGRL